MSNNYFAFQKFKIHQGCCGNKVSTDACVFGGVLAKYAEKADYLDIGSGSGLLTLILAQAKINKITGVEIEPACFTQALENVKESPFSSKIEMINADARSKWSEEKYDFIISNPPFFNNSYGNTDGNKNLARQTESLGPEDWKNILERYAHADSIISLLLSNNDVLEECKNVFTGLGYSLTCLSLLDTATSPCKRVILFASKRPLPFSVDQNFIYKEEDGSYTEEFVELLREYYLYL